MTGLSALVNGLDRRGGDVSGIGDGVVEGASCVGTVVGAGTGDRGFSMVGASSVGAAGTQRVNLLNPVVGGRVPCRGLGGGQYRLYLYCHPAPIVYRQFQYDNPPCWFGGGSISPSFSMQLLHASQP